MTTATETTASQTKPTENTTTQQITTTLTTSTITVTIQPTTAAIPVTANAIIQPTTVAIPVTANTIIQPTTVDVTVTTNAATTETATEDTERKILESVCIEMYGKIPPSYEYKDRVEYLMETAKTLTDKYSHSVADKDDLIEQARSIWIEILGSDYIERIESEYIEIDGELLKYERNVPPYTVEYYDAYDVWYINPNAPSGVTENGIKFGTPSMPPYLLIRGEDGKILGALI